MDKQTGTNHEKKEFGAKFKFFREHYRLLLLILLHSSLINCAKMREFAARAQHKHTHKHNKNDTNTSTKP